MKVKINETGKVVELVIIDDRGIDWSQDLIGNAGAFDDGQFADEGDGYYIALAGTVEWWQRYIADTTKTEREVGELATKYGIDKSDIFDRISQEQGEDYNDHRNQARFAIDEIEQEQIQRLREAAAALGKIGGSSRSEEKQNASRNNGKKGGRPAKK